MNTNVLRSRELMKEIWLAAILATIWPVAIAKNPQSNMVNSKLGFDSNVLFFITFCSIRQG